MRFMRIFVVLAVAQSLSVGLAAPFGVRLGERLGDPLPALTAQSLELFALTNGDVSRFSEQKSFSAPRFQRRSTGVDLSRPLMGVSRTDVEIDQDGVGYEFTIRGRFRRGLAREESLRKIEALRKDVERECGIKLNEYSFASGVAFGGRGGSPRTLPSDTVGGEGRGPELWADLDSVVADSVTTRDGMCVSICCGVNTSSSRRSLKDSPIRGGVNTSSSSETGASGMDSPVDVTVRVLLVDVLRKAEDRAVAESKLVADRREIAKSARIKEFFGVEFGKPMQVPTNELAKAHYETWSQGDNGEKKNHANVNYWEKSLKVSKDLQVPFVDKIYVACLYETLCACKVCGYGYVPKDVDKLEAIRRLDNFALEMNKKYGIAMHRGIIPADEKEGELRVKRLANDFVQYDFQNDYVMVSLYFSLKRSSVSFTLEDMSVSKAFSEEGWEAISEKTKDAEGK